MEREKMALEILKAMITARIGWFDHRNDVIRPIDEIEGQSIREFNSIVEHSIMLAETLKEKLKDDSWKKDYNF